MGQGVLRVAASGGKSALHPKSSMTGAARVALDAQGPLNLPVGTNAYQETDPKGDPNFGRGIPTLRIWDSRGSRSVLSLSRAAASVPKRRCQAFWGLGFTGWCHSS